MSAENEVRAASEKFYSALNRMAKGEAGTMTEIWSHGAQVTAFHPIGGRDVGWDKIGGSFEQVAKIASDGQIKLADQIIQVGGDMACETGTEKGRLVLAGLHASIDQRVTNIYRRENGDWKVVHHHTDMSPAMMDVLARLKAKA
jgi:ketosteroid isomerase-like protein